MLRLTVKNLRSNKVRFALTTFGVMLAVSFVVAAFVLGDGLRSTFGSLADETTSGIDLQVRPAADFGDPPPLPVELLAVVAEVDGEFIPNPSIEQLEESSMDLVVAGTDEIVCMIEGECEEIGEDRLLDAIEFAHVWIRKLNALQRELVEKAGAKPKWVLSLPVEKK